MVALWMALAGRAYTRSKYAGMERIELRDTFHPDNKSNQPTQLLIIPFGQLRRNRGQITKQSSRAMVRSRREVYLCGGRGGGIPVIKAHISTAEGPGTLTW